MRSWSYKWGRSYYLLMNPRGSFWFIIWVKDRDLVCAELWQEAKQGTKLFQQQPSPTLVTQASVRKIPSQLNTADHDYSLSHGTAREFCTEPITAHWNEIVFTTTIPESPIQILQFNSFYFQDPLKANIGWDENYACKKCHEKGKYRKSP